ncbi:MAG: OmpH family outer membrane protein [Phycisphaeraceae bacterium]|nr:OmpH family outer membrane protein [Phycisphaeraceae bacterium]
MTKNLPVVRGLLMILTCAALFVAAGCDRSPSANLPAGNGSSSPSVAVIDLDRLAKAIGRDVLIQQELKTRLEALVAQSRQQMEELNQNANQQIKQLADQFGPNPTPAQRQQVLQIRDQANQEGQRINAEFVEQRAQIRAQIIARFREDIQPAVQQTAAAHGFTMVLARGEQVLIFDTSIDITDAVAAKLR